MNKQDWLDYFRAVNGREPSPQEFMDAKNNGEFLVEEASQVTGEGAASATFQKASDAIGKVKNVKIPTSMANVFSALDKKWLFRQYVIAGIVTVLGLKDGIPGPESGGLFAVFMYLLCFVLTPWSRFVWLSITDFFFGGTGFIYVLPIPIMIIVQVVLYLITYVFSFILAPIGFLYLHLRINVFKK